MKTVTQGAQTRTFNYDSLKRLTSATNPESGTVNYTSYDGNGNLLSKTDARNITTNYQYDALNRLTNRSYQNDPSSTPAVSYTYDATGVSNSKGRLTQVNSTVSTTNYTGYDALGRVTGSSQTTNQQTYTFAYGYNLAGGMTGETLPSGRMISTSYDAAGRVNGVTGQKTGEANKSYAALPNYWPHGGVQTMNLGNGLVESATYNNRLQPAQISLGSLVSFVYGYGSTNNNGNVLSQQITAGSFSATQNYGYDALNRLTSASEGSNWTESYGYDQYGNRTTVTASSQYLPTYAPAATINASNNRISNPGFSYDNTGNMTQAAVAPGGATQTFGYDAENKLVNFNSGTAGYFYDGNGNRVKKVMGTSTTIFVYDTTGKLIAEYSNTAATGSGTKYITADHLGSTRLVTDSTGNVLARHDYLPFGEEIPTIFGARSSVAGYNNSDDTRQKFTAKERDTESGLDYFGARYFSGPQGRFTSPDPGPYDLKNPQSLNRYTYALNNPLKFVDPDGEAVGYILDEKKKTITLKLKVTVYGPGATQKYADELKKKIEKAWQGTAKVGKETYTVNTQTTVEVYDAKTQAGTQNPNWVYVTQPGLGGDHFEGRPEFNKGTAASPRWVGRIDPTTGSEEHEAGHMMGLGDDYYDDTGQATAGHSGHLMSGARSERAAQDEINRISGCIVSKGQSQGTIIWLPGSKTSYENTRDRNAKK